MKRELKKCLIWINKLAGSYNKLDEKKIVAVFGKGYDVHIKYLQKKGELLGDISGFSRVVGCGGDGTLSTLLNTPNMEDCELVFCPFGTMNEKFKGAQKSVFCFDKLGMAGEKAFSYVLAAGSFTPLGYQVKSKIKKRFKAIAYLSQVLRQYKVACIEADIIVDDIEYADKYSLIMVIDSPRCFGFKFNRMFVPNSQDMHLLLIRSPGEDNIKNRFKIFWPFFRAFFIGFNREFENDNILFKPFTKMDIKLKNTEVFCQDGERLEFTQGTYNIERTSLNPGVTIYSRGTIRKLHRLKAFI